MDLSIEVSLREAFSIFRCSVTSLINSMPAIIFPVVSLRGDAVTSRYLNPAPADPTQAKVMMFLPIIFTFMLAHFPAGLVIYWAWNNTLSISQQWLIMRRMGVKAT